jgi:plastocyanin
MDTGDSFSKVYNEIGSFPYVCGLHPQMRGVVVVASEASAMPGY